MKGSVPGDKGSFLKVGTYMYMHALCVHQQSVCVCIHVALPHCCSFLCDDNEKKEKKNVPA